MFIRQFVLPLIVTVWAMAQTTTTATRTASFPPVGLAASETAQINVVNLAGNGTTTAASCMGSISFVGPTGAVIGAATAFTVTSGQIFSATLPYAKIAASGRTTVRGVVSLTVTTGTARPPCTLETSLETFDTATGATHMQ